MAGTAKRIPLQDLSLNSRDENSQQQLQQTKKLIKKIGCTNEIGEGWAAKIFTKLVNRRQSHVIDKLKLRNAFLILRLHAYQEIISIKKSATTPKKRRIEDRDLDMPIHQTASILNTPSRTKGHKEAIATPPRPSTRNKESIVSINSDTKSCGVETVAPRAETTCHPIRTSPKIMNLPYENMADRLLQLEEKLRQLQLPTASVGTSQSIFETSFEKKLRETCTPTKTSIESDIPINNNNDNNNNIHLNMNKIEIDKIENKDKKSNININNNHLYRNEIRRCEVMKRTHHSNIQSMIDEDISNDPISLHESFLACKSDAIQVLLRHNRRSSSTSSSPTVINKYPTSTEICSAIINVTVDTSGNAIDLLAPLGEQGTGSPKISLTSLSNYKSKMETWKNKYPISSTR